ncbi:flavin reductase family protein [Streptomyces violaceorubidus]|uniref:Flavin reductase family protein n=1 Tax=Streptomyces violaceorubidus TaxID=284042 RepID=A0ABV1SUV1_9ACTN
MNMSSTTRSATADARDVLGRFATGVTVVTAAAPAGPAGFTCQSFTSLSLDPLLVSLAPARTSRTWPLIRAAGTFCVNVLAEDQRTVSDAFAGSTADRFGSVDWSPGPRGVPLLADACAWFVCELLTEYEGGDHTIAVARVRDFRAGTGDPLVFHHGRYRGLA